MKKILLSLGLLGALIVSSLLATPANAQATRTWVSGVGDDANPCSRTAPCKTFAGAISKTAVNGAINCLDPGGFGGVTITKSIDIVCQVEAGVLVAGTNGITINSPTAVVYLRGLDIQGVGTGLAGIRVLAAASVYIDDCSIHDFNAPTNNGWGIRFTPGATAELTVSNTRIFNNGDGVSGGAILINAVAGTTSKALISKSIVSNNFVGIRADGVSAAGGSINVTVSDTVSTQNTGNAFVGSTPVGGATVQMLIDRSVASNNNAGFGVLADGAGTTVRIGNMVVSGNTNGVGIINTGILQSYKNNEINNNTNDGTPVTAVPGGLN